MKKFMLAAIATCAAGSALAADLGSRPAATPVMALMPSWQGFYMGGHIGGVQSTDRVTFENASVGAGIWAFTNGDSVKHSKSSFAGGLQAGYNWQFGQFVTGVDVSATFFDTGRTRISPFFPGLDTHHTSASWLVLAQGRLGMALGSWLIFGQGGVAFGDHDLNLTTTAFGLRNDGASSTRTGWTIGAGVNYLLTPNWIVGAEYSYVDFGRKTYRLNANGAPNDRISSKLRSHIGKITVSYKF